MIIYILFLLEAGKCKRMHAEKFTELLLFVASPKCYRNDSHQCSCVHDSLVAWPGVRQILPKAININRYEQGKYVRQSGSDGWKTPCPTISTAGRLH